MALDRRDFIKFAIGGAVGTMFTPIPWKLSDDISIWSQNWGWIPRLPKGEITQKNTMVKLGNSPYGAKVTLVGKRPITISGTKENPLSLGAIDPIGAAAVALRYSPSRILNPKKKDKQGKFIDISYDEAEKILLQKLESASKNKNSILFISGDDTSSCNEIFSSVLQKLNSSLYFYEPSDREKYFKAWYDILNGSGEVGFDIENSDCIVILGCNFLDSWGTYVRNQRVISYNNTEIYFIGPYKNNTSAVAKKSFLISERDLYKFIFGVINHLIKISNNIPAIYGIREFVQFISYNYKVDEVAKEIGCLPSDIKSVAVALNRAKKPLIIAGSTIDGGGPIKNILAGLILNIFLDRINKQGGIRCIPEPPKVMKNSISHIDILKNNLLYQLLSKEHNVQMALFYETNPFYSLPKEARKSLEEIPFKVCFSLLMDETASQCDLIIPSPHFLEKMDDCFSPFGSGIANYFVSDKVVSSTPSPKNLGDVFLKVAKKINLETKINSYRDILNTKAEYLGISLDKLLTGHTWTDDTFEIPYGLKIWDKNIEKVFFKQQKDSMDLELTPIKISKTGTDITGLFPFSLGVLYEIPKKGVYALIHPNTGKNFHLKEKDRVKIESSKGNLIAEIKMDPGVKEGVVAILYGLGRKIEDPFNKEKGESVSNLFEIEKENNIGTYCWSINKISLEKI